MQNKNSQFIAYLASLHPSASITVLMKLSYLIDLISSKRNNSKISNFKYIRYNYGPFCQDIYNEVEVLVLEKVLLPRMDYVGGTETLTYSFNDKEEYFFNEISDSEKELIREAMSELSGYGAKTLTELAYKTKPMTDLGATLGGTEGLFSELKF